MLLYELQVGEVRGRSASSAFLDGIRGISDLLRSCKRILCMLVLQMISQFNVINTPEGKSSDRDILVKLSFPEDRGTPYISGFQPQY